MWCEKIKDWSPMWKACVWGNNTNMKTLLFQTSKFKRIKLSFQLFFFFWKLVFKTYCVSSFCNWVLIIAIARRFWVYKSTSVYEYKLEYVFFFFNEFTRVDEWGVIVFKRKYNIILWERRLNCWCIISVERIIET